MVEKVDINILTDESHLTLQEAAGLKQCFKKLKFAPAGERLAVGFGYRGAGGW